MRKRRSARDQSIHAEPHLSPGDARPDPSEKAAARKPLETTDDPPDEEASRSVFDEPTQAAIGDERVEALRAKAFTYDKWLGEQQERITPLGRLWWIVMLGVMAGPLAVVGTFASMCVGGGGSLFSSITTIVIAPSIEEVMKTAMILWAIEKHPYAFNSRGQIILAGVFSGAVFAAIENVIYLNVYIPDPDAFITTWRWTVCVLVHTGCTVIASLGLARVWHEAMREQRKPSAERGAPYLIAAVVVHGAYNALAVSLDAFGVF